jgi:ethanolamine utilization protein EutP (predicted NTPase)
MAAALVAHAKTHGVSSMLLVPASGAAPQELEQLVSAVSGVRIVVGKNIDEMSADELSATPSACVVVATKDETDMQDVERTQQVLRQAGNNVVGMMLIAAHD